ncbi:MAG: hypothetical protein ACYC8T_34685 [Myxococcaceae bacterium]
MSCALLATALSLCASVAPAKMDLGPVGRAIVQHMQKGLKETKVGDWVTYKVDGTADRVHYWRLAVVGEEKDPKGRDAYWIEIDMGEHHELKAPLSQMRMLVAKSEGLSREGITRMVVAFGYEKPQEMAPDSVDFMTRGEPADPEPAPAAGPDPRLWVRTGKESRLMTLAGTVAAVPVEVMIKGTVVKRMWMSRQVPVLHLAKMEIPAIEHSMEVRDYGIDARPRMVLPAPGAPTIRMERYDDAALMVPPEGERDAQPSPRP